MDNPTKPTTDATFVSKLSPAGMADPITGSDGVARSKHLVTLLLVTVILANFGDGYCTMMMSVALPDIADRYGITLADANWVTIGFAITAATIVMMTATIMQRIGLTKLFFWSRVFLIVGCLLGLFALNYPMMLVGRLLQGMAAGALFPIANSVVIRVVPPAHSGAILSLNSAAFGLSVAVAPLVSGLFLSYVSLRSIFLFPLVLAVATMIMGFAWVHNVEPRSYRKIDPLSVVLAAIGLATLMYGFNELTDKPAIAIPLLVVGIALLVWFARRQLHLPVPVLDLTPLRNHLYVTVDILLYMTGAMGQQAVLLLLPLYFERARDFTEFVSGVLMLIVTLFYAVFDVYSGRIVDKHGMWPAVFSGFALMTAGLVGTILLSGTHLIWLIVIVAGLGVMGFALINVPGKDVVLERVPSDLLSHVNAAYSTSTQIASSIGSALFVGILSADVVRLTARGISRSNAYVQGFQHSMWIAVAIEAVMTVVSLWYSRQMLKHHMARLGDKPVGV
ncbi:MFS transporter [Bifidobacterium choloepi]|uniref:Multidrug efflux MFS transporter n=1 Tax=Bifidobacterium choloepi TaxID=2614131 RepID=A0A6I5NP23_9BIFI|nr:MFS transporter [Bifidobacterium choloepi]NEG70452.1 multidrug efflux MFS transporter [Bifidobacterium choloepi]